MPKTVSSSEAQNNFGAMLQWTEENRDEIVVERRGKPTAVLMAYDEYEEIQRLRLAERKRQALASLHKIRVEIKERARARGEEISPEEAYVEAGMSPEIAAEIVRADQARIQAERKETEQADVAES